MAKALLKMLLSRLLLMLVTLFGVLLIVFLISRWLPGSPVELMLGAKPTTEQIAQARLELGLDQPLVKQFGLYLADIVQGDLGTSLRTGKSVASDIGLRLGATFELVTLSLLLAVLLGIPLGVMAARTQDRWPDHLVRVLAVSAVGLPVFFLGILMQIIFSGWLQWAPLQGRVDPQVLAEQPMDAVTGLLLIDTVLAGHWAAFQSALAHLALPVMTLGLATVAVVLRVTRNLMVEVLGSAYIRTAHAYGMSRSWIHWRFALKPVLIPLLTVIGLTWGYMLGGSVIAEYVFGWPGIGQYVVDSVISNDFPAVMGVTLVLATAYLSVNLIVDMLYLLLDPRERGDLA